MKKSLILLLICFLSTFVRGEVVTMALLQPIVAQGSGPCHAMDKNMVRGELRKAFGWQSNFQVLTRNDVDQVLKELGFQQSGMVDENQRKRVGVMTGAQYICVSTLTKFQTQLYIESYLVNVETGEMTNPASQYINVVNNDYAQLPNACNKLAEEMLGGISGVHKKSGGNSSSSYSNSYSSSSGGYGRNQDFIETAWGINMKMIWVEGGDFLMGCTSEQGGDCNSDEQNVRRVTVDGYYIGMLEVTQEQWEKVVGTSVYQQWTKASNSGSPSRGVGSNYPMYCVSWEEAMEFCRLLSQKTGKTYTLPTEAQWEYAARGGKNPDGTKYSGSNMIDVVGWYTDNSGSSTHPCGTKRANSLGIYDMSGNVWEWCKDWYANSYVSYDTNNPTGPSSGSYRVFRGGGWGNGASDCRVAYRNRNSPGYRGNFLGFRVVLLP